MHVEVLTDLAVIMCVAAATTLLFHRIKQPVVLGYLVAGMIVGPHVPVPLFADEALAHELSELGVVLLMFSLGLEFSLRALIRVGPSSGLAAAIQSSFMIWLGYLAGRLFGWTALESLFEGAIIAISSTTIIVKAFADQGVTGKIKEIVFGILIVEDLIAVLLLALLTPLASGGVLSARDAALALGKLALFLAGTLGLGLLGVPRLARMLVRVGRSEMTVVASVGLSFAFALLARRLGYSVALGAFLAGTLVAESGVAKNIEQAIEPVRDVFAAVFFVSVGMLIDPVVVARHWLAVLVLTALVVTGKVTGVTVGAFLAGHPFRTSLQAGMSLAQIGEFSFIIAGVGLAEGAARSFLYPVAVAVAALTTLLTPYLIRASGPVASFVDERLPQPVQTVMSLYASWVEALRTRPPSRTLGARIRKLVLLLAVDTLLVAAVVIAASLSGRRILAMEAARGIGGGVAHAVLVALSVALAAPFVLGAVRVARALGTLLAAQALPAGEGRLDLGAAPRRALLVILQLCMLLGAGIPLLAVTQPFLPSVPGAAVLLLALAALAIPFWRSASDLQTHVRAGAQVVLEALARGSGAPEAPADAGHGAPPLLPGLGEATAIRLAPGDAAVGKTLRDLDLRLTGATVVAIERDGASVVTSGARDRLRAGDLLVLTGTAEAVAAARQRLSRTEG